MLSLSFPEYISELKVRRRSTAGRCWSEHFNSMLGIGTPTWLHERSYIYFERPRPHSEPAFLRISTSDRKLEKMVAGRKAGLGYGWWGGLTPDDSPLMTYAASTHEIFTLDWIAS